MPSKKSTANGQASGPKKGRRKVVIIGALGMDFHTFNMAFRDNEDYEVLAFTVAGEQNVGTTEQKKRSYPKELAGKLYPKGVPMIPEVQLEEFVKKNGVDEVVFAYSDVSHPEIMHKASRALSSGADYRLISQRVTQIKSKKPLVAICSVRTGCGKSQVSRYTCDFLIKQGYKVVAIREPMPYGDLVKQTVMRFASYDDFTKHGCTVEEREEYEPYVEKGMVIYAGVDYQKVLEAAEAEADVIVWDGGNNEISFYKPDLLFVVADPLRPGAEVGYHPGEANARAADVFIVNKMNNAKKEDVKLVEGNLKKINPKAPIIHTNSVVSVDSKWKGKLKGKTCLVVEDGPTITHGDMGYGAGLVAAQEAGCKLVSPQPFLKGCIKTTFDEFSHITDVVPAMGYSDQQLRDLEATLNAADCDVIMNGSPIDLAKLVKCNKPIVRTFYEIENVKGDKQTMEIHLQAFKKNFCPAAPAAGSKKNKAASPAATPRSAKKAKK